MSLPRGAVAWSVIVAFSCASHAPRDQVRASGPLVVFCCRVAMLYVSASRCRGLVCDCGIFPCLSCPLGSGEPFRSSCCVLLSCGCKCYMSLPRGAVAWSAIVTFSRASYAPWDQVSHSDPLVVFCCRVAMLYVSSSRCRGLVCDCYILLCLSCPLVSGEPFRASSCVLLLCGCKCYMSLPRGAVAWSVIIMIVTFSCPSHVPWDQVSPSGPLVVFFCHVAVLYVSSSRCRSLVCDCDILLCLSCPLGSDEPSGPLAVFYCCVAVSVICLFLAVPWLGL